MKPPFYKGFRVTHSSEGKYAHVWHYLPGRIQPVHERHEYDEVPRSDFDWGTLGNGSFQLAYVLLVENCGHGVARRFFQRFAREKIALLPSDEWVMAPAEIIEWVLDQYGKPEDLVLGQRLETGAGPESANGG